MKAQSRINVYLTNDEKQAFGKVAASAQRSMSSMARHLIVEAIKHDYNQRNAEK